MAEGGNHQSSGSSTADWMKKVEESMKSMMDRLERIEGINNKKLEVGTIRRKNEIAGGKRATDSKNVSKTSSVLG